MKDWSQYKGVSGIYAIENTVNGKVYIGQSQDVRARWKDHFSGLERGSHVNAHLQNAWKKYGASAFRFLLLDAVPLDILDTTEQAWITSFDAVESGYNLSPTAGSSRGIKRSEETRRKVAAASKQKWADPETGARLREARKRQGADPEFRAKVAEGNKRAWADPECRLRTLEAQAAAQKNPSVRERMESPEAKKRHSDATKRALADPTTKKRQSESIKRHWSDLSARARRTAAVQAGLRAASKLTEDMVAEIRRRYVRRCPANGGKALAAEFGTSPQMISLIVHRKIWV